MIGKDIRLRRLIDQETKRMIIVPMDHGVTVGPINGIVNMEHTIRSIVNGGASAIILHKGLIVKQYTTDCKDVGLIIHLSAGTVLSPDSNVKTLVCTVEEALKLGADAVSVHINIGANTESDMLKKIGYISKCCLDWGMPLIAMMYTRGPKITNEYDTTVVKHAARVGAELGADIVKVNYTGSKDSFREVVEACHVPVVIAGGEKIENDEEIINMVKGSLESGAAGVSIGRNIFQHDNPEVILRKIAKILKTHAL